MTPMRIRTLNASAGLLTALTLGVASLAGCAPFDPNPAGAAGGVNTPPATTPATTAGNPAVTPSTTPASTAPTTAPIKGLMFKASAEIGGKPLANASFKAYDLITGKALPLVAAGSMNLTTDAQGNFSAQLPVAEGQVVKLVAQGAGKGQTVSTLVAGGAGGTLEGIDLTAGNLKMAEGSTVSSNVMSGMFQLAGNTAPAQAAMRALLQVNRDKALALLNKFFAQANQMSDDVDALPKDLRDKLMESADAGGEISDEVFGEILAASPEFKAAVQLTVNAAIQEAGKAEVLDGGLSPETLAAAAEDFKILEDLGFMIDTTGGELELSGNGITITVKEDDTPEVDPTFPVDPNALTPPVEVEIEVVDVPEEVFDLSPVFDDEASFSPTVSLTLTSDNSLRLNVVQAAGEEDVEIIYARIPTGIAGSKFADFVGGSPLASGSIAGGMVPSATNGTFQVISGGASQITFGADVFGVDPSVEDSTPWIGKWVDGNNKKIADVNVFETLDFIYLVIKNELPSNAAITQRGHSTTMTVPSSGLSFTRATVEANESSNEGTVQIKIKSRADSPASVHNATYTDNIAVE